MEAGGHRHHVVLNLGSLLKERQRGHHYMCIRRSLHYVADMASLSAALTRIRQSSSAFVQHLRDWPWLLENILVGFIGVHSTNEECSRGGGAARI